MNKKQGIAIIAPLFVVAMMYPIFQILADVLPGRIAWYLGLVIYWIMNNLFSIGQHKLIVHLDDHKSDAGLKISDQDLKKTEISNQDATQKKSSNEETKKTDQKRSKSGNKKGKSKK